MSGDKHMSAVLFQDTMDSSRFLKIESEKKNTFVCKVFFGKNKNNLSYHGKTELAKRFFNFNGESRIGFNPAL